MASATPVQPHVGEGRQRPAPGLAELLPLWGAACPEDVKAWPLAPARFNVQASITELTYSFRPNVFLATDECTGRRVAVKTYIKDRFSSRIAQVLAREINVHSRLNHPRILPLYAAFECPAAVYIVMEYAGGHDLLSQMRLLDRRRLQEASAVQVVLAPLLEALSALHRSGIIHGDIKPENVMFLTDGSFKLADFSLSVFAAEAETRSPSFVGTPPFMAPEILRGQLAKAAREAGHPLKASEREALGRRHDYSSDVWSVGVLAYEILGGHMPYDMVADKRGLQPQSRSDIEHRATLRIPSCMSDEAADFVKLCMADQPSDRPSAQALLRHPLIVKHVGQEAAEELARAAEGADPETAATAGTFPTAATEAKVVDPPESPGMVGMAEVGSAVEGGGRDGVRGEHGRTGDGAKVPPRVSGAQELGGWPAPG
ncbi:unnamed protein product [Pedinophyceae sp. YPF-701]|nr:unnamed protein product [Pedinophyceae sp. YPF-701]